MLTCNIRRDKGKLLFTTSKAIYGVHISTSLSYEPDTFATTIKMIETRQIDPSPVVTDEIEFEDIVEKGFEQLINDKSQSKILVKLNGND